MRHQTMLIVLATAFSAVCSVGPLSGRAQNPVMTLTAKKDGAFKGQGGSSFVISSLKDVSSIMKITRSNMDVYLHNPREPLVVSKGADAFSSQLLNARKTAEVIPEISFKLYKPGDNQKYKIVTLGNVTISDFTLKSVLKDPRLDTGRRAAQNGRGAGEATPGSNGGEELHLTYTKIAVAYYSGGNGSAADDWDTK